MADLTFYNAKHAHDLDFAIKRATSLINDVCNRDSCRATQIRNTLDIGDTPPEKAKRMHDLIQQVMFSSGYYCDIRMEHKHDGCYDLITVIIKMTPEEKAENHHIPEALRSGQVDISGDPQSMD